MRKHPAVIQSFRSWGSDFPESIERWQAARARPMLHITTADSGDGHELITPREIAQGYGDEYLIRLNRLFWAKRMRAYIRPLGEPNRCLNVYAAYDCAGKPRGGDHALRWYRRAFRRIYVIVHGGGKRGQIDARLSKAGVPPLKSEVGGLAEGAGRPGLEHAAGRLADRPPQPAAPLLPRRRTTSTGSAPMSTPTTRTGRRSPASTAASRASPSRCPSGESPAATTRPSSGACSPGSTATHAARCSSTTRTSAPPAPTGCRTTRRASPC